ncbi:MAG: cytochrome c [Burkholderiales bacterium]|nr:cytochrome c [Burkholderiales bacterium]
MSSRHRSPSVSVLATSAATAAKAAKAALAAVAAVAALSALPALPALAQPTPAAAPTAPPTMLERGRLEFESNCATCHGMGARGDGPMRPFLAREPADLTTIARRRGGSFPRSEIADLIDGRGMTEPGVHGTREMPIWGRVYREQSEAQTRGTPFPAEWSVRGRTLALAEYLQSLQRP